MAQNPEVASRNESGATGGGQPIKWAPERAGRFKEDVQGGFWEEPCPYRPQAGSHPMSERYPRIRVCAPNGTMLIREGLSFTFYMRRFHEELLPGLLRSLDEYRRAVGPEGLGTYWDQEGDPQELDAAGWALIIQDLTEGRRHNAFLGDSSGRDYRYDFKYRGRDPGQYLLQFEPDWVSAVSFWMPTEYLEEHGPEQVRALALALAAPLPFCSGHVGLSFNAFVGMLEVYRKIGER